MALLTASVTATRRLWYLSKDRCAMVEIERRKGSTMVMPSGLLCITRVFDSATFIRSVKYREFECVGLNLQVDFCL